MGLRKILLLLLIPLFLLSCLSYGVWGENSTPVNPTDNWDTIKDAYIYCFPLVLMDATMQKRTNTVNPNNKQAPVNQFYHGDSLDTSDSKDIVTPNVDTVYSEAFLDLNKTALVFVKPKTDRFCSAQIMDAYTNTIEVVGSGGKMDNPQDEQICLLTGRNFTGDIPEGMQQVAMPTDMAWILVRIVCNGPDDISNITAIQKQISLVPLEYYLSNKTYVSPKGRYNEAYNFTPVDHVDTLSPEVFFDTANRLMVSNPPAPADASVVQEMQSITVGPDLVFDEIVLGDNGTAQWDMMLQSMNPLLSNYYINFSTFMGNWMYYGDPIAEWGTDYPYRALIAQVALGANPTYVAIYPGIQVDTQNQQLSGNNKYILHFDEGMLPPVKTNGFWSVTAYGPDSFLISNDINRYCINDRSNVTYNSDGSLDVLLQAESPADEMQNNWLPVGTKNFHIIMRMYLPDMDKIQGDWTIPEIVKQ